MLFHSSARWLTVTSGGSSSRRSRHHEGDGGGSDRSSHRLSIAVVALPRPTTTTTSATRTISRPIIRLRGLRRIVYINLGTCDREVHSLARAEGGRWHGDVIIITCLGWAAVVGVAPIEHLVHGRGHGGGGRGQSAHRAALVRFVLDPSGRRVAVICRWCGGGGGQLAGIVHW